MDEDQKRMLALLEQMKQRVQAGQIVSLAVIRALPNNAGVLTEVLGVRSNLEAIGLIDAGKDSQTRRSAWRV